MSTQLHKKGVLFQQLIELLWDNVISIQLPFLTIMKQYPLNLALTAQPTPQKLWQVKDQMKRQKNIYLNVVLVSQILLLNKYMWFLPF